MIINFEIIIINLASTTGDLYSFRVEEIDNIYNLKIVDEYETVFKDFQDEFDHIPSQGEILDVIILMNTDCDSQPYWLSIIEMNGFKTIDEITNFIVFDSNIYPSINILFKEYLRLNQFMD